MIGAFQAAVLSSVEAKVYATFDPAFTNANIALSNGNLTAKKISATNWTSTYLTIAKTSGLWAYEILLDTNFVSNGDYMFMGMGGVKTLTTHVGNFNPSVGKLIDQGGAVLSQQWLNSISTNLYWNDPQRTAGSKLLCVFDMNNKKILGNNGGVLKASGAIVTATPYIGASMYATSANSSITLNTGQSAFSVANEALIVDYELANSVVINRGVWL